MAIAAPAALVIAACMSIWASSSGTQQLLSLALPLWAGKHLLAAFVKAWAWMLLAAHVCASRLRAGMLGQGSFAYLVGGFLQVG